MTREQMIDEAVRCSIPDWAWGYLDCYKPIGDECLAWDYRESIRTEFRRIAADSN